MHASNARRALLQALGFQLPQRVAASEPLDDGRAAARAATCIWSTLRRRARGVAAAVSPTTRRLQSSCSIFTAIWDWRASSERTGESYDEVAAAAARGLLDRRLAAGAAPPAPVLAELRRERRLSRAAPPSPRRGIERHLARAIESSGRTRRGPRPADRAVRPARWRRAGPVGRAARRLPPRRQRRLHAGGARAFARGAALRAHLRRRARPRGAAPLGASTLRFRRDADVDRVVAEACGGLRA